ncbi:MAG: hypothetical protein IKC32_07305 [Clostridia bacterium]|nr:hypothetical protein [Clostridia bacterium]
MKKRNEEFDVKELAGVFMPKLWIIVICALLCGALLGGYTMLGVDDTYTSKATFMVSRDKTTTINTSDIELSYKIIENLAIVVDTNNFLSELSDEIRKKTSYNADGEPQDPYIPSVSELASSIAIKMNGETVAFSIYITTDNPYKSHIIAETMAEYMDPENNVRDNVGEGSGLIESLDEIDIRKFLPAAYSRISITTIESPLRATVKNNKGVVTSALIGILAGGFLSVVVIYLLSVFDSKIRNKKKLEAYFDIPVIGVIPAVEPEKTGEVAKNEEK